MADSIFGDLDLEQAATEIGIGEGTWPATLYKAEVVKSKEKKDEHDNLKVGLMLYYKATEGDYTGQERTEYKEIPQPVDPTDYESWTDNEKRAATYLRRRLNDLGIPEDKHNSVNTDDLENLDVLVTIKKNGEYYNVTTVRLVNEISEDALSEFSSVTPSL